MYALIVTALCFVFSIPSLGMNDQKKSAQPFSRNWADMDEDDDDAPPTCIWWDNAEKPAAPPQALPQTTPPTPPPAPVTNSLPKVEINLNDFIPKDEQTKALLIQEIHEFFPIPTFQLHEDLPTVLEQHLLQISKANKWIARQLNIGITKLWPKNAHGQERSLVIKRFHSHQVNFPQFKKLLNSSDFSAKVFLQAFSEYEESGIPPLPKLIPHIDKKRLTPYYACLSFLLSTYISTNKFTEVDTDALHNFKKALTYAKETHLTSLMGRVYDAYETYYRAVLKDTIEADTYHALKTELLEESNPTPIEQPKPAPDIKKGSVNDDDDNDTQVEQAQAPIAPTRNMKLIGTLNALLSSKNYIKLLCNPYEERKWALLECRELDPSALPPTHSIVKQLDFLGKHFSTTSQNGHLYALYLLWPSYFQTVIPKLEETALHKGYDSRTPLDQRLNHLLLLAEIYQLKNQGEQTYALFNDLLQLAPKDPSISLAFAEFLSKNPLKLLAAKRIYFEALEKAQAAHSADLEVMCYLGLLNLSICTNTEVHSFLVRGAPLSYESKNPYLKTQMDLRILFNSIPQSANALFKDNAEKLLHHQKLTHSQLAAIYMGRALFKSYQLSRPSDKAERYFKKALYQLRSNWVPETSERYLYLFGLYYKNCKGDQKMAELCFDRGDQAVKNPTHPLNLQGLLPEDYLIKPVKEPQPTPQPGTLNQTLDMARIYANILVAKQFILEAEALFKSLNIRPNPLPATPQAPT